MPIRASYWGVMKAKDAPVTGRRLEVLPAEPRPSSGVGRASYAQLSLTNSGPVRVEPLDRKYLKVGVEVVPETDEEAKRDGLYRDDHEGLVGWVAVETLGVVFTPSKSGNWARSDVQPIICHCGHPHWSHERRVVARRRWRIAGRRQPVYVGGRCIEGSCRCRRFRPSKRKTADPLSYLI
jgi:hypothetical protein